MKIWTKIIDKTLRQEAETGEHHFGFRTGEGTIDAAFALWQIIEKYLETGNYT